MTRFKTRYPGCYFRLDAKGERRYQISYTDSSGKRVFKTVEGNEKDALRQRNQILERMHKGEKVVSSKMTVKTLAEDYMRTQTSHLRESTLGAYGYSIDHWVIPALGNRKVNEVGVDDIADFIAEMRQTHAAWTIRGCLTPLSRMFQYAVRKGLASSNPVTALDKQERPRGATRMMRILSKDEIDAVVRASTDTYKALIVTAIFAGLRLGELLKLKWEDVDLAEREIYVRESKTEAGIRTVVITDDVVKTLASYGNSTTGFVFKTKQGTQMKHRSVQLGLETTLKRAKVEHCRFHDLRHTYASILVGQGEDVTYVADQMGHASASITLDIYTKLFDPKARRTQARERMQEAFKEVFAA